MLSALRGAYVVASVCYNVDKTSFESSENILRQRSGHAISANQSSSVNRKCLRIKLKFREFNLGLTIL